MHVIAEISIQSNATENPFSRQTDIRHSEVIGKAAADDQRNNSNIPNLNANNTNGIPLTSCRALSFYCICSLPLKPVVIGIQIQWTQFQHFFILYWTDYWVFTKKIRHINLMTFESIAHSPFSLFGLKN